MLEIKFTLDATPEILSAVRDLARSIHSVARPEQTFASAVMPGDQAQDRARANTCKEKDNNVDGAKNLTEDVPLGPEQAETPERADEPKKRKPREKKARSESNAPVSPSIGDNSSPIDGKAEPKRVTTEETDAPETAPETEPPPAADDPAPVEEAPAAQAEDPLAGKGQTGEILAELTRKAIGDLDAMGVDRGDANRRIRDYCARNEIKFPTFPALLQAVGYAEAIAICKGA